jgi:hypothetical protein
MASIFYIMDFGGIESMRKLYVSIVASVVVLGGTIILFDQSFPAKDQTYKPAAAVTETMPPKTPDPIKDVRPFAGMQDGPNKALVVVENDFMDQTRKMNANGEWMNEAALISSLHALTHQKIKADRIGFSIKMTPER